MKFERDSLIYLILFTLISLEAYRDSVLKSSLEKRVNDLESICWNLTAERGKINRRIDRMEFKNDSLQVLYLHK